MTIYTLQRVFLILLALLLLSCQTSEFDKIQISTELNASNNSKKKASLYVKKFKTINARHDFPYESHYVEVKGSKMHYVDTGGKGTPIVMLHGQPTWSYLWRNIIPYLEDNHRVIALDLIGFGKSDKPNIGYTLENHADYLAGFMDALALDDVTLIIHDWGSFLGFDYAARNPERVKAIAFMESFLPFRYIMEYPLNPAPIPTNPEGFASFIVKLKTHGLGEKMIIENNEFLTEILPSAIVRKLSDDEMAAYLEPFSEGKNRWPMLQLPRSLVMDGINPVYVSESFTSYIPFLKQKTDLPLLMLTATPGGIGGEWQINWVKEHLPRTEIVGVGEGVHFIQEDQPDNIGKALISWMKRNNF
ncbi:MAG: haloalkane dehalogenase [Alcanivoracaceae bacterium]|nr:haloalkane dehalogenase [Alcanivoracaceae bacterium]